MDSLLCYVITGLIHAQVVRVYVIRPWCFHRRPGSVSRDEWLRKSSRRRWKTRCMRRRRGMRITINIMLSVFSSMTGPGTGSCCIATTLPDIGYITCTRAPRRPSLFSVKIFPRLLTRVDQGLSTSVGRALLLLWAMTDRQRPPPRSSPYWSNKGLGYIFQ